MQYVTLPAHGVEGYKVVAAAACRNTMHSMVPCHLRSAYALLYQRPNAPAGQQLKDALTFGLALVQGIAASPLLQDRQAIAEMTLMVPPKTELWRLLLLLLLLVMTWVVAQPPATSSSGDAAML
jgi:hypothetical protein